MGQAIPGGSEVDHLGECIVCHPGTVANAKIGG
jgi:hypothetical protein